MTFVPPIPYVLLVPLGAAVLIALLFRRQGGIAATLSLLAAAFVAVFALKMAFSPDRYSGGWEWLRLGDFTLSIGVKYDDLAALMLVIVGVVGLCVHVFSLGYMHEDGA